MPAALLPPPRPRGPYAAALLAVLLAAMATAGEISPVPAPEVSALPADLEPGWPGGGPALPPVSTTPGPIEITSSTGTTFISRVATATGNVSFQRDGVSIYADYGEYELDSKQALFRGHVRIYRDGRLILADRAAYNLQTGALDTDNFAAAQLPFFVAGRTAASTAKGAPLSLTDAELTTHDSDHPDYRIVARQVTIYPDDRVVYRGVKLYLGQTPILYLPYFYTSLDQRENAGLEINPGQSSIAGAFLLIKYGIPLSRVVTAQAEVDYRTRRGLGIGANFFYRPNAREFKKRDGGGDLLRSFAFSPMGENDDASTGPGRAPYDPADAEKALSRSIRAVEGGQLLTYFTHDRRPDLNRTNLPRVPIESDRFRVMVQDIHFFTDDFLLKVNVHKLSDPYVLQDFFRQEFVRDPQPDNNASLTLRKDNYTITLITRVQLNSRIQDVTERLPELVAEWKRQEIFPASGLGIFYEGETGFASLRRNFASDGLNRPDYQFQRFDTLHQFTRPTTIAGWLNVAPRIGFRGTFYSKSAANQDVADSLVLSTFSADQQPRPIAPFAITDAVWRPMVFAGMDASFKLSRVYSIESRLLGLDRVRHIVQPFVNFQIQDNVAPTNRVPLPADRQQPTTQLDPLDPSLFTAVDSIRPQTTARFGVRQRLQTRRDALTFNWMELDSYFQREFRGSSARRTGVSNFYNNARFRPVPWAALVVETQAPLAKGGFTEINSAVRFMPARNVELEVGHRYLQNNPFFPDSSLMTYRGFWRVDENWAVGAGGRLEFDDRVFEQQTYTVYRDLTSFVGSLSAVINNNRSTKDYGVVFSVTLKDLPRLTESFTANPSQSTSTSPASTMTGGQ